MRRKAVQIMIKMIQRRLDAILHWNISFVGGFLGGYAILSHAGVFGSAQTGNLMEMASNVRFMEWEELGLRLLAMVIFACGVIASYMLTNYTNLHMRKLAIWVDAAGLGLTALLPDWFSPIAGVYPIFCQRILRPAEDGLFEVVCDEDRRAIETICAGIYTPLEC